MSGFKFWIVDKRTGNKGRPAKPKTGLVNKPASVSHAIRREINKIRDNEFIDLYRKGKTLQEIGDQYGISRERVRQRLAIYGMTAEDGGQHLKAFVKAINKHNKRKVRKDDWLESFGCTREFRDSLGGYTKHTPCMAFIDQKRNAIYRGIQWELTLHEWWDIWQESGKWEMRGLGSGKYVMGRECDSGPYSKQNVKIITHNENSAESRLMDKILRGKYINSLSQICKDNNINRSTVDARIRLGWDIEAALNTPVRQHKLNVDNRM
jgi:hypothetical protein